MRGVVKYGGYFGAISDDARNFHQDGKIIRADPGESYRIKIEESLPQSFPLVQDDPPVKAGLESIQFEELEQPGILVKGNPHSTL